MTTIRKATIKDCEKIAPLWTELMEFHSDKHYIFKTTPRFKDQVFLDIKKFLDNPSVTFFVAEQNNEIVGFSMTKIVIRPTVFDLTKSGHIGETYVHSGLRGQGIGAKLISEVKSWFKEQEVDFIDLQVTRTNKLGKKFWENNGFKVVNYLMINDLKE